MSLVASPVVVEPVVLVSNGLSAATRPETAGYLQLGFFIGAAGAATGSTVLLGVVATVSVAFITYNYFCPGTNGKLALFGVGVIAGATCVVAVPILKIETAGLAGLEWGITVVKQNIAVNVFAEVMHTLSDTVCEPFLYALFARLSNPTGINVIKPFVRGGAAAATGYYTGSNLKVAAISGICQYLFKTNPGLLPANSWEAHRFAAGFCASAIKETAKGHGLSHTPITGSIRTAREFLIKQVPNPSEDTYEPHHFMSGVLIYTAADIVMSAALDIMSSVLSVRMTSALIVAVPLTAVAVPIVAVLWASQAMPQLTLEEPLPMAASGLVPPIWSLSTEHMEAVY